MTGPRRHRTDFSKIRRRKAGLEGAYWYEKSDAKNDMEIILRGLARVPACGILGSPGTSCNIVLFGSVLFLLKVFKQLWSTAD